MSVTLHPSGALGFNRPLTQPVKRSLSITNHNAHPVAFKVKTTAPKLYCVRPNSGRVEPGKTVELQVLLQAMKEEPPLSSKCKDKFLIQSTVLTAEKETLPLHDIWNTPDASDTQVKSQKIRVVYLPPGGQIVPKEDEGPIAVNNSSMLNDSHYGTVRQFQPGNEPIMGFHESEPPRYEESQDSIMPGISSNVENFAVHPPPPREPTPRQTRTSSRSNNEDVETKLAEATAEISRLRSLLVATPEPSMETNLNEVRQRHRNLPSGTTTIGSDTDVSSYVKESLQQEGVPLPIVIIIALGVFITTYLFF